jgi:hypothetical protein
MVEWVCRVCHFVKKNGRYLLHLPKRSYRGTAPNQTITDRDFTGQRHNRAVGLLYYQARCYLP